MSNTGLIVSGDTRTGLGGGKAVAFCLSREDVDRLVIRHLQDTLGAKACVVGIDYDLRVDGCAAIAWHLPVEGR